MENRIATSVTQSMKLRELGISVNTADMYWSHVVVGTRVIYEPRVITGMLHEPENIPCWSLSALLKQIPSDIKTKDGCNYTLEIEKADAEHLPCGLSYHDRWGRGEDIITHYYDNFIDACYEMILKLYELKML